MDSNLVIILIAAIGCGLYMAWAIGANDVANSMGTSVGAGAVTVGGAIVIAGVFEFLGAFLAGGEVTSTIRKGIIDAESQGAAQASCARPASCAVSSSAHRLRGTARPTWRGERIAARCRRGGAAPAPSRLECHRGVQCGITPLSLRPQGRHSGLSRPVPCLVQSAHAALGTAQGDQCSRVPDRTAGPRLAHAARLSALADTALIHGRCRALALLDTPRPRALRASGQRFPIRR